MRYRKTSSQWRVDLGGINYPGTSKTFAHRFEAIIYAWILLHIAKKYCTVQEVATYTRTSKKQRP